MTLAVHVAFLDGEELRLQYSSLQPLQLKTLRKEIAAHRGWDDAFEYIDCHVRIALQTDKQQPDWANAVADWNDAAVDTILTASVPTNVWQKPRTTGTSAEPKVGAHSAGGPDLHLFASLTEGRPAEVVRTLTQLPYGAKVEEAISEYGSEYTEDFEIASKVFQNALKKTAVSNKDGVFSLRPWLNRIPASLRKKLVKEIDAMKAAEPADYHPRSKNVVRDLVHPSLYPLVTGVSPCTLAGFRPDDRELKLVLSVENVKAMAMKLWALNLDAEETTDGDGDGDGDRDEHEETIDSDSTNGPASRSHRTKQMATDAKLPAVPPCASTRTCIAALLFHFANVRASEVKYVSKERFAALLGEATTGLEAAWEWCAQTVGVRILKEQRDGARVGTEFDMWGRPYEDSKYQWLPAEVKFSPEVRSSVEGDGLKWEGVRFESRVNNLDHEKYPDLVGALEELLGYALPILNDCYRQSMQSLQKHGSPFAQINTRHNDPKKPAGIMDLREAPNSTLQVIVKIVDYELDPSEVGAADSGPALRRQHEGVWHVEGMSHERIVLTALYILEKDPLLEGCDLLFKRGVYASEARKWAQVLPEVDENEGEQRMDEASRREHVEQIPLGRLTLPEGTLAVWPNSHIHKITKMKVRANAAETSAAPSTGGAAASGDTEKAEISGGLAKRPCAGASVAKRRIIVFWVIDPNHRIPSTKDVPEQKDATMTQEEAFAHRLELMEERMKHKTSYNLREVHERVLSLCEH